MPMPQIKESDQEADSKSNGTQLTEVNLDASQSDASKPGSEKKKTQAVDPDCKWCQMRDDGSKCIICDLNDDSLF